MPRPSALERVPPKIERVFGDPQAFLSMQREPQSNIGRKTLGNTGQQSMTNTQLKYITMSKKSPQYYIKCFSSRFSIVETVPPK